MSVKNEQESINAIFSEAFETYLNRISPEGRDSSKQEEEKAYSKMLVDIDKETNPFIKAFMQDTVLYLCKEEMLFTYYLGQRWNDVIQEEREILKSVQPIDLYIELEKILANQSDSYGYTKTFSSHRYPLNIPGHYTGVEKVRYIDKSEISPACLLRSYYKFGVHTYRVGHAIKNIIECMEDRYGLNFKELEDSYQRSLKG